MNIQLSNFLQLQLSPLTQRIYGFILRRFLKFFDHTPPAGNSWTKDYINHLKNQGLSNKSVNHQMTVIKQFYKFAFGTLLLFDRLKENSKPIEFLTTDEITKLRQASNFTFIAILSFMLDTGARVSEITQISQQKFDQVPMEFVITGKGMHQRTLIISAETHSMLEKLYKNGLIFGRVWTIRAIQYNLKLTAKKAEVKHIHPHLLRHTFATQMLWQGVDIRDIQQILGHKHLNTTQIYTHVTPDRLRKVWNNYLDVRDKPDNKADIKLPV